MTSTWTWQSKKFQTGPLNRPPPPQPLKKSPHQPPHLLLLYIKGGGLMGGSFKQNKVGWRGLFKRPCWTFLRDKVLSNSDCLTLLWIDKRLKPEKIRNVNMNGKLSDPIVCRWGPWRQWKQQHHQSPGNKNMSHRRKKEEMVLYPFWFTKK